MRRKDWEARLADYLGQHRGAVFDWGQLDCALFAAGAVEAMTGVDPAAEFRGHYDTKLGSVRALHKRGYSDLKEVMDTKFGTVPPGHAQRGDIVLVDGSLGVCTGRVAHFVGVDDGAEGLVPIPMRLWEDAWRIPFAGETDRRD